MIWRSRMRLRWRALLVITLLLGLGAGAGLGCLAGARRTASSFGRIAAATNAADINSGHGLPPAEAEAIADRFTGVTEHETVVGFVGVAQGVDPALFKYFIGPWEATFRSGAPILRSGRYPDPDRAEEVLVSSPRADAAGIAVGTRLTLDLFNLAGGAPETKSVVVTGTGAVALEAAADSAFDRGAMYFTPAFTRANLHLQAWSATSLTAAPGTDDAELVPQLLAVGWSIDEAASVTRARVQDALRPLTMALGLLGVLVLAATLVVVGQALARQRDAVRDDNTALRALGLTADQARTVDLLTLMTVVVPGAALAAATAIAVSPLFPAGSVRRLEPDRGMSADITVCVVGALVVIGVLLVAKRVGSRRAARPARPPAPARLGPLAYLGISAGIGMRLAAGATGVDRRRFRATVAMSAAALALVIAGVGFVGALDRLSKRPVRYGVGWELTSRNAYGDVDPEALTEMVAGDTDIEGMSGADLTIVLLDDEVSAPALAVLPITAELWPTVVTGRVPRNDDEILVGAAVLDKLAARVGDVVDVRLAFGPSGDLPPAHPVAISGTAIFPSVELAGVDPTRLGTGVAMTWGRYTALQPASDGPVLPDIIFFDLADGVDPGAVVARYPDGLPETSGFSVTEWLPSLAPAEVRETTKAIGLIWSVIAFVVVTVIVTIANTVAATVRRRRGDYAVLKALGLRRSQVRAAVAWQAIVAVAVALVVAVPVGVAAGRWAWRLFARFIGVIDTPVVALRPVLGVVVGSLLAAALVALAPGVRAGRVPPVTLHRE